MIARLRQSAVARFLFALTSGPLLGFAFPNVAWGWLAFFALTPLIVSAVLARTKTEAFLLGLAANTTTWLFNVPWVVIVMSRYGGLPLFVGILMYVAMCLALGAHAGVFTLFVHPLRLGRRLLPWFAVPAIWIAIEYGRTYWLSGFPWHLIATALIEVPPFAQPSRWLGPYGLGYFVVSVAAVLAWLALADAPRRTKSLVAGGVALTLIGWAVAGQLIITAQRSQIGTEKKHLAAMVQPNIAQEMRWDLSELDLIFDRMARLTETGFNSGAEVVVWPESTLPLTFLSSFEYRLYVESTSRRYNGDIILGSVAEDFADSTKIWNAAYLISRGSVSGRYDKIRLVPFGEYVPLRKALFFARKLVQAVGNFQFGTNEFPLVGKFKYGPAICYEVVYPRVPANQVRNGAEVLVTITNDAWFGRSAAPRQHLNHVRMRAIETDRWFLRAATTGISALIDPTGRIVRHLPLEREGLIVGEFGVRQTETAYVRFGDWPAFLSILVVGYRLLVVGRRWRTESRLPKH